MNNLMGKSCPQVIKELSTQIHDVLGNTTETSEGTYLKLSCYYGFRLTGNSLVKCHKGRWDPEISQCTKDSGLSQGLVRTTNPYLLPSTFPTTAASSTQGGGDFQNYWGVSRDDMILILSVCLAVAFILLVILIIALAFYLRKRRKFWEGNRRRVAMRRMVAARRQMPKALLPPDKRYPPWMLQAPMPAIYARPSGRPMYYPSYDYRWQHLPGRPHQMGYPFLMYPQQHNMFAMEEPGHYTWNTNKSNPLRKNDGGKGVQADGRASETESIEVVWDAENMAWLEELEYTDSKIPRPSLNKPGSNQLATHNASNNSDEIAAMSGGQDNPLADHLI